jgi:hypothetical protein
LLVHVQRILVLAGLEQRVCLLAEILVYHTHDVQL